MTGPLFALLACVLVAGCGGDDARPAPRSAPATLHAWADAVARGDLRTACRMTVARPGRCAGRLRPVAGRPLAVVRESPPGVTTRPGERHFSLSGAKTVLVTAVPSGDGFRIRVDALVRWYGGE